MGHYTPIQLLKTIDILKDLYEKTDGKSEYANRLYGALLMAKAIFANELIPFPLLTGDLERGKKKDSAKCKSCVLLPKYPSCFNSNQDSHEPCDNYRQLSRPINAIGCPFCGRS